MLRLIDVLYAEYTSWYKADGSRRRIRDPDKIRQHLTHFVLEAFRTHKAHPELSMGVHLGKDHYGKNIDRYHAKLLSYSAVKHVTDFLVARHYMERPSGIGEWNPDPRLRRTTRFCATQKLIDLCNDFNISRFMIVPYENPEVIILRARKKQTNALHLTSSMRRLCGLHGARNVSGKPRSRRDRSRRVYRKDIEQYKKQQSAKARELDKNLKKAKQQYSENRPPEIEIQERTVYRHHWLP